MLINEHFVRMNASVIFLALALPYVSLAQVRRLTFQLRCGLLGSVTFTLI